MNMIACATVIRGKGGCQAFMNWIVNEEMQRLNEQHAAEMARVTAERDVARRKCDKWQDKALKSHAESTAKKGFFARLKEGIVFAWCCLFAWMLEFGLIEEDRDEE